MDIEILFADAEKDVKQNILIKIQKVMQKDMNVLFFFEQDRFNIDIVDKLMKTFRNRIKFSPAQMPYITFKLQDKKNTLEECKEFLGKL